MAEELIRPAVSNDMSTIIDLDRLAQESVDRRALIEEAVERGDAWVVETSGGVIGYGIISHGFFGRSFVELVYIAESHRSSGYGPKIVAALEGQSRSQDLFTSTNESNLHMRHVLEKRGYERSGVIHNLDPGDPEYVYIKRSVRTAAPHEPTQESNSRG